MPHQAYLVLLRILAQVHLFLVIFKLLISYNLKTNLHLQMNKQSKKKLLYILKYKYLNTPNFYINNFIIIKYFLVKIKILVFSEQKIIIVKMKKN